MVVLLVVFTVIAFLAVEYLIRIRRQTEVPVPAPVAPATGSSYFRTPRGVFFDPGHTWVYLKESGDTLVGLDDFAQSVIGSMDGIQTPAVGDRVSKGDIILEVRHGERTAAFRAPVDGRIEAVNKDVLKRRNVHSSGPITDSWLYKIEPDDVEDIPKSLLLGDAARAWLNREVQRLRVFLATMTPRHPELGITMEDGGPPSYGLIDELDNLEWKKIRMAFFA